MRFPALNLSGIYPDQITSANVYIRDLMAQQDPMYVYCHAFYGNSWSESTANWSNVNPNSYGSSMSSKNVYYDGSRIWYDFSILGAVKDWSHEKNTPGYSGSARLSKGVIFKANSTVENGSAYLAKTFGSYNNGTTSYKPYLVVNYDSITPTITLNVTSVTLTVGQTYQLTATTNPLSQEVRWHPSNPGIARVTNNGLVTAVSVGTSTIIASFMSNSGINDICTVNVSPISGVYYIKNVFTEKFLTVSGQSIESCADVVQMENENTTYQKWRINYESNNLYSLVPISCPNMRLDVRDGVSTSGTKVQQYPSNYTAAQRWYITYDGGTLRFSPQCAPGTSLSVNNGSLLNGTNIIIETTQSISRQQWRIEPATVSDIIIPNGVYRIRNRSTGQYCPGQA